MRTAACACGALTVACEGEPVRVSVCHCLECQRRTGSAFGVQARYPRAAVRVAGASVRFERTGDSGGSVATHFCPVCGTTVYLEVSGLPDFVIVAVGAFADPGFPAPEVSIYEARRHAWVDVTAARHLD